MEITECEGYKKLIVCVERDEKKEPHFHDYRGKLAWIIERANHYAEKTGLEASDILDAWEKRRGYWYMNYYQESQQPTIIAEYVRIFDTQEELMQSVGTDGYRCPMCGGVSQSPYDCNSGKEMGKGKICDWKVWGLFGDLGKGVFVFVKDQVCGEKIFMPLTWEKKTEQI